MTGVVKSDGGRQEYTTHSRIRHRQQRLLLLHHAAKCRCHKEGSVCTVTPHCGDMKRLWRHLQSCRDHRCMVLHCVSSRAILSHYRNCQNQFCPSCSPVRALVANSKCSNNNNAAGGHQRSLSRNNGFHANGPVMLHNKDRNGNGVPSIVMPTRAVGHGSPSIVIPPRAVPAGAVVTDRGGSSPGGPYNANGLSTVMPPPPPMQQREQQIMATCTVSAAAAASGNNAARNDQAENAELKKENAELKRKVAELMMENHHLQQENAQYTRGTAC